MPDFDRRLAEDHTAGGETEAAKASRCRSLFFVFAAVGFPFLLAAGVYQWQTLDAPLAALSFRLALG